MTDMQHTPWPEKSKILGRFVMMQINVVDTERGMSKKLIFQCWFDCVRRFHGKTCVVTHMQTEMTPVENQRQMWSRSAVLIKVWSPGHLVECVQCSCHINTCPTRSKRTANVQRGHPHARIQFLHMVYWSFFVNALEAPTFGSHDNMTGHGRGCTPSPNPCTDVTCCGPCCVHTHVDKET